jgi:hypothetical protein
MQCGVVRSNESEYSPEKLALQLQKEMDEIFQIKIKKCLLEGDVDFYEHTRESEIRKIIQKNINIDKSVALKEKLHKEYAEMLLLDLNYLEYVFSFCYKKTFLNQADQDSFDYKNTILKELVKDGVYAHEECIINKKKVHLSSATDYNAYLIFNPRKIHIEQIHLFDLMLNQSDKIELKNKFAYFFSEYGHCYAQKKNVF